MKTNIHILTYFDQFFIEWEVLQKNIVEKIERIFCVQLLFIKNHTIYVKMWKYIVKPGTLQIKIWHMRIACWITKATSIYSEYVILLMPHYTKGCKDAPQYYVIVYRLSCLILFINFLSKLILFVLYQFCWYTSWSQIIFGMKSRPSGTQCHEIRQIDAVGRLVPICQTTRLHRPICCNKHFHHCVDVRAHDICKT
jgi:hypothetical protein